MSRNAEDGVGNFNSFSLRERDEENYEKNKKIRKEELPDEEELSDSDSDGEDGNRNDMDIREKSDLLFLQNIPQENKSSFQAPSNSSSQTLRQTTQQIQQMQIHHLQQQLQIQLQQQFQQVQNSNSNNSNNPNESNNSNNNVNEMSSESMSSGEQLRQSQLSMMSMMTMTMMSGLPLPVLVKIGQLPLAYQQQFFVNHQEYMKNLHSLQQAQLRGQPLLHTSEVLLSIRSHQQSITLLMNLTTTSDANLSPNKESTSFPHPIARSISDSIEINQTSDPNSNLNSSNFGINPQYSQQSTVANAHISSQSFLQNSLQNESSHFSPLPVPANLRLSTSVNPVETIENSFDGSGGNNISRNNFYSFSSSNKIPLPPWLQSQGEKTHSDQQLSSGADLSKTKKKYRFSMCVYCAKIYPESAWATLKSRKFEHEVFKKHEKSSIHQRSLLELNKCAINGIPISFPSLNAANNNSNNSNSNGNNVHESNNNSQFETFKRNNQNNLLDTNISSDLIEIIKPLPSVSSFSSLNNNNNEIDFESERKNEEVYEQRNT